MEDTIELRVLLKYHSQLVASIRNNLEDISLFLYNEKIILKSFYNDATDLHSRFGEEEKAKKILRALENKVQEDEKIFLKFLEYLFSKTQYSKLRGVLVSEYEMLGK